MSDIPKIDFGQAIRRVFEEGTVGSEYLRVGISSSTDIQVDLDSTADSIRIVGTEDGTSGGTQHTIKTDASGAVVLSATSFSSTGLYDTAATANVVVVGPLSTIGIKDYALYANTTVALDTPGTLTLQLSPDDSANVWLDTTLTLTPATGLTTAAASSFLSSVARRARVISATAPVSGSADIYLVGFGR